MDRIQKIILISIISIAAISWILSIDQPDMMTAMMNYNPIAISLFTISWTIGMAAMMFPAIAPMVLLYNRLIKPSNSGNTVDKGIKSSQSSVFVECDDNDDDKTSKRENRSRTTTMTSSSNFTSSAKIIFFVGSYLLVWAITGIVLLLAWSIPVNYFFMHFKAGQLQIVYGIVLIVSGVYQFSSLKTNCLGYCWPYFLLMVALGWMNLLWMVLFAGIIFGEKVWSKGIWVARSAGVCLAIVGIMAIFGLIIIIPSSMNDNNNNLTNGRHDDTNMDGMNMDMSKNMNVKKPTPLPTTMSNMKSM